MDGIREHVTFFEWWHKNDNCAGQQRNDSFPQIVNTAWEEGFKRHLFSSLTHKPQLRFSLNSKRTQYIVVIEFTWVSWLLYFSNPQNSYSVENKMAQGPGRQNQLYFSRAKLSLCVKTSCEFRLTWSVPLFVSVFDFHPAILSPPSFSSQNSSIHPVLQLFYIRYAIIRPISPFVADSGEAVSHLPPI